MLPSFYLVAAALFPYALAHGDHDQQLIPPDADWATKHMLEEHHISDFDAASFFNLHDYDSNGFWTPDEIAKTYGIRDPSVAHITNEQKTEAIHKVLELFDRDHSGDISYAEYVIGEAQDVKLPDFGFGPGHHGDDEYEYEIHHFEKYHGADTTAEDLTHPEDIEHFRKHDEMEEQAARQEKLDRLSIIEANIPHKFRRQS